MAGFWCWSPRPGWTPDTFPNYINHGVHFAVESTGVPQLTAPQVAHYLLPVPPESEQRAIAEALSDVDGLLAALEALIAKKRAVKQAAMQQLLTGKSRLPEFSGAWETTRLGDIASFFKGSGLSKADLSLDGRRRCVHYGELFTVYGERITEVLHGTDREGIFFHSIRNDVLMPTSDVTPNGLATASCILASDIILGGDVLVIRVPESVLNGEFLAYAIKIHRDQVMQLVSGTTVFHLYGRDMANFSFAVPSVDEQTAIVSILSDMDAEITALEQRRDKTHAVKQSMMQQLLTGWVRLVAPKPDGEKLRLPEHTPLSDPEIKDICPQRLPLSRQLKYLCSARRKTMTQLLQEAFERVAKLSQEEQNKFARFLLAALESDQRWAELFERPESEDLLERLADENFGYP